MDNQNPSVEEVPCDNGMAVGFKGGRPPDDMVVVDGLNALERSGSPVPGAVQPLQKRGRSLDEAMIIDDEPSNAAFEMRGLDGGVPQLKGVAVGLSESSIPSFKDKLVGDKGALDPVVARSFKLLCRSKMPNIVAFFEPPVTRQKRNSIKSLQIDNQWCVDQSRLREHAIAFFQQLFMSERQDVYNPGIEGEFARLGASELCSLSRRVTMEEVLPEVILYHLAATPPPLPHLGADVPGWRWDDKREFRVSFAYSVLMQDGARVHSSKWARIWSLKVPQRVKVFLWITVHHRLLTNVERVRRHIASSDMCGLCFRGPEDIDHVLRHCEKANELWRNVLGHEVAASLSSLSFEDWLHGNISGSLPAIIGRTDWDMEFAIYCWLLWKLRCSMVLDLSFVERESVWDRGRRLLVECQAVFAASVRGPAAGSSAETRWASLQGNRFAAPPASVALAVAADKQHWEDGSMELEVA
ncbi:hypothetical protein V6N13_111605 [Hibiscus sabdariffa]